jgi:hypothetical protein
LYKHGIALSKTKIEFAKTRIEYLGLILAEGKVELQENVLKSLQNFPDEILDKRKLQRFLGCLNYIIHFYEQQAKDARILQRKLRGKIAWNSRMTATVQIIKQKVQNLPKLHLPSQALPFILEIDASDDVWACVLLQKHTRREEVCMYTSGCFKDVEERYPSSHKEILIVKNGIK